MEENDFVDGPRTQKICKELELLALDFRRSLNVGARKDNIEASRHNDNHFPTKSQGLLKTQFTMPKKQVEETPQPPQKTCIDAGGKKLLILPNKVIFTSTPKTSDQRLKILEVKEKDNMELKANKEPSYLHRMLEKFPGETKVKHENPLFRSCPMEKRGLMNPIERQMAKEEVRFHKRSVDQAVSKNHFQEGKGFQLPQKALDSNHKSKQDFIRLHFVEDVEEERSNTRSGKAGQNQPTEIQLVDKKFLKEALNKGQFALEGDTLVVKMRESKNPFKS